MAPRTRLATSALVILAVALALGAAGRNPRIWAQGDGPAEVQPEAVVSPLLQYQGRLTNPAGAPLDGTYTMVFRLYTVSSGGAAVWTETKDVTVTGGLFSTLLGDSTALDPALFNGQALWLGVKVGADAEATPRQQITPVAYAFSLVPGALISTNSSSPALQVTNLGAGAGLQVNGNLSVSGNLIGGSHVHDDRYYTQATSDARYLNAAGPDSMSGSSANPLLNVTQTGAGAAGYFTSTSSYGVHASSQSYAGVWADVAGSQPAVAGNSTSSGYGVYGYSAKSYGGYFSGGTGQAIMAAGSMTVTGDLKVSGNLKGANTSLPIAYGLINTDGSPAAVSPNVSSSWNAGNGWYEISISGVSYSLWGYVTEVTLVAVSACRYNAFVSLDNVNSLLLVRVFSNTGASMQCPFAFVTYKP